MKTVYTKALLQLLRTDAAPETVLSGFAATLKQRGHSGLAAPVLQAVLRELSAERAVTTLTLACGSDRAALELTINTQLKALGADAAAVVEQVDDTLIGGYTLKHADQYVDASYKTALHSLYQSITR